MSENVQAMITRSGKSLGMVPAGGDGSSSDPNAQPRSSVGNGDQSIMESNYLSLRTSSATERQEALDEGTAYATVSQHSEFDSPEGGLGLDSAAVAEAEFNIYFCITKHSIAPIGGNVMAILVYPRQMTAALKPYRIFIGPTAIA